MQKIKKTELENKNLMLNIRKIRSLNYIALNNPLVWKRNTCVDIVNPWLQSEDLVKMSHLRHQ